MKQIAMLRRQFENQWQALADAEDRNGEEGDCRRWISRFESLLIDTFGDVFDQAKKNLEPQPPEFAYKTVRDWCLAANETHGRMLFEVENHLFWEDVLLDLVSGVASEIAPADLIYRPQSQMCLETLRNLRPRGRDNRKMLSQMHPYLTYAMENILAQKGCATLHETVENFPVLRGLKEDELQRFRGNSSVTAITSSKELLNARLRTVIGEDTVDRYFRPTEHSPK